MEIDSIQILGFSAGIISSSAMIPQVLKTWRKKEVGDVSKRMYIMYLLAFVMWISYGVVKNDFPIMLTNTISLLLSGTMLYFKFRFKE